MIKHKLVRITTVPISLEKLLEGQLGFMKRYFHVIAVSSEQKALEQYASREGVDYQFLDMTRKITPFKDVISLWNLYTFFRKEKPTIVHSHTPKAGIVGMLAAKLAGVPVRLHTVAGLPLMEATGAKLKLLKIVEKLTYACATKVYPNASGLHKYILGNALTTPSKTKVLGNGSSNGIDTNYFSPRKVSGETRSELRLKHNIATTDFVFIFVGRLVGDKGINELVSAFEMLCKKQSSIKLILVGPLEVDLDPLHQATMQSINNNKHIISVGYQQDVRPFMAVAHVLVFPSYREGFPNVVMQAGAMGLPIIASEINGCDEIVIPQVNGMLIKVKDMQAILQAMETIQEQRLLAKLKANVRESIVKRYQRDTMWKIILAEYNNQLKDAELQPLEIDKYVS